MQDNTRWNFVLGVVDLFLMRKTDASAMGNSFASNNMWDNAHRPEQMFTVSYLAELKPDWTIKTEYPVNKLTLDGKPYRPAILDIAVLQPRKIAIRLNGGYHRVSERQQLKDEFQKKSLEQAGWQVIDIDDHMYPTLFKVSAKSSDKTLKLATEELDHIAYKNKI